MTNGRKMAMAAVAFTGAIFLATALTGCDNAGVPAIFTVSFDTGTAGGIEPVQVESGSRVARPETDPTRNGYDFKGWFSRALPHQL